MLWWGLIKQARHEHMPDEYKKQYIIDGPRSPSWAKVRDTTIVRSELNKGRNVKRTNTGLPNMYHITKLRNYESILLVRTVYSYIFILESNPFSLPDY